MVHVEGFLFGHGVLDSCWRVSVSGKVLAGKCWRESVGLAALARHTIVAGATIKPVPGQRKGEVRALAENS